MQYSVQDAVGTYCIMVADGEVIYTAIRGALIAGEPVALDFTGVNVFAAPFFNAAVGRLLKDISSDDLNRPLPFMALIVPAFAF